MAVPESPGIPVFVRKLLFGPLAAAVLAAAPATIPAADVAVRDVEGVFASDDGLAQFTFFAGKPTGAPAGPDGAAPVEYRAVLESSIFTPGEYRYRRLGRTLDVTPALAGGAPQDPVKNLVFIFTIVDEDTLYEDETGVTYHRTAGAGP